MSTPKIKVCGMREPENIKELMALKPDYVGFIFYPPSPRHVGFDNELSLEHLVPNAIKTGVFVNSPIEYVIEVAKANKLDAIQLHGKESTADCRIAKNAGLIVIKVFSVDEAFDFKETDPYQNAVDFVLFDTKTPKHGGSGLKFNWEKLQDYRGRTPFFLSGGIGLDDAGIIAELGMNTLHAVDINSKFEIKPGLKDIEKIKRFTEEVRNNQRI